MTDRFVRPSEAGNVSELKPVVVQPAWRVVLTWDVPTRERGRETYARTRYFALESDAEAYATQCRLTSGWLPSDALDPVVALEQIEVRP